MTKGSSSSGSTSGFNSGSTTASRGTAGSSSSGTPKAPSTPSSTVKVKGKTKSSTKKTPNLSRKQQAMIPTSKSKVENAGADGIPRHVFITATGKVKLRRKRVPLEKWQKEILEKAFQLGSIPSGRAGRPVIADLATKTELTTQKVAKWVENRYAKERLTKRRALLLQGYAPDVYKARLPQKQIEELAQKDHELARKASSANKSRLERSKARTDAIKKINSNTQKDAIEKEIVLDELKLNPLQPLNESDDFAYSENDNKVHSTTTARFEYISLFLAGKLKPQGSSDDTERLPWADSTNSVFVDSFLERLTLEHFYYPFKTVEKIVSEGELNVLKQHMDLASAGLRLALVNYWLAKLGERSMQKEWRCFEFVLRSVTNTTHLNKSIPELFARNLDNVKACMIRTLPYDKTLMQEKINENQKRRQSNSGSQQMEIGDVPL
eukprot:g2662.t1